MKARNPMLVKLRPALAVRRDSVDGCLYTLEWLYDALEVWAATGRFEPGTRPLRVAATVASVFEGAAWLWRDLPYGALELANRVGFHAWSQVEDSDFHKSVRQDVMDAISQAAGVAASVRRVLDILVERGEAAAESRAQCEALREIYGLGGYRFPLELLSEAFAKGGILTVHALENWQRLQRRHPCL